MSIRRTPLVLDEYYHIYSRGVDRRTIFIDQEDRERFIRLLFICNSSVPIVYKEVRNLSLVSIVTGDKLTAIGAYCLMGNHFHLLLKETKDGGITQFTRKLLTAYSSYFNRKYERTGALFSSKFKSSHLHTDEYLKYIFSYIHLNPLKNFDLDWKEKKLDKIKARDFLDRYHESSYLDYVQDNREEALILNKLAFPEYFPSSEVFAEDIFSWFEVSKEGPW